MSASTRALIEQLKRLPPADQQEVFRQLLLLLNPAPAPAGRALPALHVPGGPITSEQVAETLDDE